MFIDISLKFIKKQFLLNKIFLESTLPLPFATIRIFIYLFVSRFMP